MNILEPVTFAFLIIGCMVPYWFAALTMKSVGQAGLEVCMAVRSDRNPSAMCRDTQNLMHRATFIMVLPWFGPGGGGVVGL